MKKLIALVAAAVMITAFSISTVGKKLPSVGYVLVGPKTDGGWSMRLARIYVFRKTWL